MKKLISLVTPCRNEEENVRQLCEAVKTIFAGLPDYDYEHIFIDNSSSDRTVDILREIAVEDKHVKVIVNIQNYESRSGFHAIKQTTGDAFILMACDFQDPPALIPKLIELWEAGNPVVVAVKAKSEESAVMYFVRKIYYRLLRLISSSRQIQNFTGFGIFDRLVRDCVRHSNNTMPYFRGMVAELGLPIIEIEFVQPRRLRGKSSHNLYRYYDTAMIGFVNHSRLPLRFAIFVGLGVAFCSLCVALFYLVYKLLNWDTFNTGMAPLVLGLFFFSAVQLIFLGVLGEYVGAIWTQVRTNPNLIEKERINFPETETEEK